MIGYPASPPVRHLHHVFDHTVSSVSVSATWLILISVSFGKPPQSIRSHEFFLQFCSRLNMNFPHNEPLCAALNREAEIIAQLPSP